jgi:hypothetical protein
MSRYTIIVTVPIRTANSRMIATHIGSDIPSPPNQLQSEVFCFGEACGRDLAKVDAELKPGQPSSGWSELLKR